MKIKFLIPFLLLALNALGAGTPISGYPNVSTLSSNKLFPVVDPGVANYNVSYGQITNQLLNSAQFSNRTFTLTGWKTNAAYGGYTNGPLYVLLDGGIGLGTFPNPYWYIAPDSSFTMGSGKWTFSDSGANLNGLTYSLFPSARGPAKAFLQDVGASGTLIWGADGGGLTNLNAANLASGTVPSARLPALAGNVLTNGWDYVPVVSNGLAFQLAAVTNQTPVLRVSGTNALLAYPFISTWFLAGAGSANLATNIASGAQQNTGTGHRSLMSLSNGYNNTAYGALSLELNVTGYWNTAVGIRALRDNLAYHNTAVGVEALYHNTGGTHNTAFGASSMVNNLTGVDNTSVGWSAARDTLGDYNVAVGSSALQNNTSGSFNVAVGLNAQQLKTTGDANTAIGDYAIQNNRTGSRNTVVGYKAAQGSGADALSENSILGYQSGQALTTGSQNILVGFQAGNNLTAGTTNIMIGYNIQADSVSGSGQLNIGGQIKGLNGAITLPGSLTFGSLSDGTVSRAKLPAGEVTLTETTATAIFTCVLANSKYAGFHVFATTHADDGADFQSTVDDLLVTAVNKGGTVTLATSTIGTSATATAVSTAGTLTTSWTATASGTTISIKNSATSSLVQTTLKTKWRVEVDTDDTALSITPQ